MRNKGVMLLLVTLAGTGCSSIGDWKYSNLNQVPVQKNTPRASTCMECHDSDYNTWKKTDHASTTLMKQIPVPELRECGACHNNLTAHVSSPERNKPSRIQAMNKTAQNQLCGKCHFNKDLLGNNAINPHLEHGLFSSAGFDEHKKHQISCLDCHKAHSGRSNMLQGLQAHTCFKCHKSAIITMGVFQPVNYLAAGKVCTACHAPHGTSKTGHCARMTVGLVATCLPCHLP